MDNAQITDTAVPAAGDLPSMVVRTRPVPARVAFPGWWHRTDESLFIE
ncbi:hypothetical protein ACVV2G_32600 [Streptomyces ziwulingensis]